MRILFTTTRGAGHFEPLLPFARACLRAGDEVLVAAPGSVAAMVERAGLRCWGVGEVSSDARNAVFATLRGLPEEVANVRAGADVFVRLDARRRCRTSAWRSRTGSRTSWSRSSARPPAASPPSATGSRR